MLDASMMTPVQCPQHGRANPDLPAQDSVSGRRRTTGGAGAGQTCLSTCASSVMQQMHTDILSSGLTSQQTLVAQSLLRAAVLVDQLKASRLLALATPP